MARLLLLLLTAVLALSAPLPAGPISGEGARPGQPAPAFHEIDLDGVEVSFDRYRGRPVVLWFSNFSDGHVAAAAPLVDLLREGGVALLVVSLDGAYRDEADAFRKQFPVEAVLRDEDGSTARAYTGSHSEGAVPLKNLFLIGPSGIVVARHHYPGAPPRKLEDDLRRL